MNILIPMNSDNIQEGQICNIKNAKKWAMITIKEGKVTQTVFKSVQNDFDTFAHIIVISNNYEDITPFIEKQMEILVAPTQKYIDDIVEAYLFKELHDFSY